MSLAVYAYSEIRKIDAEIRDGGDPHDLVTGEYIEDCVILKPNPYYEKLADSIELGAYVYKSKLLAYSASGLGYRSWRTDLENLAKEHASPEAFRELIDFSDCEGIIGPVTAAKLLRDFDRWEDAAIDVRGNFYDTYCRFKKSFEIASQNGVVVFR